MTQIGVGLASLIGLVFFSKFYAPQQINSQDILSFFAGAMIGTLNLFLLAFGWYLIFKKKIVVLAISSIVFKYALIGFAVYYMVTNDLVHTLFFGLGLSSLLLTSMIVGACEYFKVEHLKG